MTVSDIVTQLKYGELRSIAVKDDIPAIVSYINLGLLALYGRFKLARSEQIITMVEGTTTYTLNSDVILIEGIYAEDGTELAINEDDNYYGVFTPTFDTVQIPNASGGNAVSVMYIQAPADIIPDADDAVTMAMTVRLPAVLMECLLHYIGYRAHGSMNGDIKAENNTHYMRYEAACKRVKDLGLIRDDVVQANVSLAQGVSEENGVINEED